MVRADRRLETLGILGVGKSTFVRSCQQLVGHKRLTFCFEDLSAIQGEIEFWLGDRSSRSHFIQTVFYAQGAKSLSVQSRRSPLLLADFSLLGHHFIYSRSLLKLGLLSEQEFSALEELVFVLDSLLPPLAGFILCEAPVYLIERRARQRARINENSVDLDYLRLLEASLAEYMAQVKLPIFRVDTAKFDLTKPYLPQGFNEFLQELL